MTPAVNNRNNRLFEFGPFRLNPRERQLLREGEPVTLTPKAFDTLVALIESSGHVVGKEELMRAVWPDTFIEENTLTSNISTLRKALGQANGDQYIETVPKLGYRFVANVSEVIDDSEGLLIHRHTRTRTITETKVSSLRSLLYVSVATLIIIGSIVVSFRFAGGPNSAKSADASAVAAPGNKLSENPKARDAYSQGRYFYRKRTTIDIRLSKEYFQQAIANDPTFALAYVGLADAYLIDDVPKAEATLRRALELDESLGEAHASLGFLRMFWHWDWLGSEQEFKQAVALSPQSAEAHQWYALFLASQGRLDEAKQKMSKALELEPNSPNLHADFGQVLYFAHDYNDAIAECRKALDLDPHFILAHSYLNDIYAKKGMYAEAVEEVLKAQRSAGRESEAAINGERASFVKSGWRGFLLARPELKSAQGTSVLAAEVYAWLQDYANALKKLDEAYDSRDFFLAFIRVEPAFDDLRSEVHFQTLLRQMNLN